MNTLETRKQNILKSIILQHIKSNETVSSNLLAKDFSLSPATLRNEMADLEENEFICQPHTSAGRIPTEKGYKFFIANFLNKNKISQKEKTMIESFFVDNQQEYSIKQLARIISEISKQTVFIGFHKNDIYITGLSNLFRNPEFTSPEVISHIGIIVDNLEKCVEQMFDKVDELEIFVGSENPFTELCSSLMFKSKTEKEPVLWGILGPIRMDYSRNYSIMSYTKNMVEKTFASALATNKHD